MEETDSASEIEELLGPEDRNPESNATPELPETQIRRLKEDSRFPFLHFYYYFASRNLSRFLGNSG
jgi:hypothetical protein